MKSNSEFLAAIYSNEGLFYEFNLEYFKAIEKYEHALKLTKEIPLKKICLHQIGVIYYKVRKYKESVQYYSEALELLKNNESASNASLISVIDLGLGTAYMQLKNYKTALSYFQKTLDTPYLTIRDKAIVYNDIGQAYLSVDSLDKAELFIDKAIAIYDSLNIKNEKLSALGGKAELLTRKKQWNQLSVVVNKITVLASDVQEYYMLYDCFKFLSNYYENTGNYKKSNEYLKKWITVNDSINNRDFVNKISEFRFKYETEEKEQQISMQQSTIKQKDKFIVLSVIAGSLIFAALLVIFILYRIRNKAYRLLVYQSLENMSNAQLVKMTDHANEEDTIETNNCIPALDEKLKKRIEISLNKQLDVKVYLEPNFLLKTLAEKCGTNRSYLSQFINERYNTNFNTFINTLRINEAKLILSDRNNDIPLKELYPRLGFSTYSVFNEAFKKHVGVTPNFYLKTVKELLEASNLQ